MPTVAYGSRARRMFAFLMPALLAIQALGLSFPQSGIAELGVGVDLGSISVDETLTPGVNYDLPAMGVLNTGDVKAIYSLSLTPIGGQEELTVDPSWVVFTPATFELDPDGRQEVALVLNIPDSAEAGDYFALLEARPQLLETEGARVGVGAATKLSFTIARDEEQAEEVASEEDTGPGLPTWVPWVAGGVILVLVLIALLQRFRFTLGVQRRE